MSTGAPIYLVSACSSGEEFVAAFRRYADRSGLFVPIADPIPVGRKGRFALTLADGSVMVEGEAEVISSARAPSVLHGRVGMTIRFTDPDPHSKTVLVELEKARLVPKPAAPSVPPRPAEVPAAPRPTPPAPGGRIDANNARAECVAIGDLDRLVVVAAQVAKPGARFVVPTIPPVVGARPKSPSTPPFLSDPGPHRKPPSDTGGFLKTTDAIPRPVDAPKPGSGAVRKTTDPGVGSPSESGRHRKTATKTQAVAIVPPPVPVPPRGSIVRPELPTPTTTTSPPAPISDTLTVPPIDTNSPRVATPSTGYSETMDVSLGDVTGTSPPLDLDDVIPPPAPVSRIPTSSPNDISGITAIAPIPTSPEPEPAPASDVMVPVPQAKVQTPEDLLTTIRTPRPQMDLLTTMRSTAPPMPPIVGTPPPAAAEVEIGEPTDLTVIPTADDLPDAAARRTDMGIAVVPGSATVLPAVTPSPDEEPAPADSARAARVMATPQVEEATPSGDWTMIPGAQGPTIAPRAPEPRRQDRVTGDWSIQIDNDAPDGWSPPSKVEKIAPRAPSKAEPVGQIEPKVQIDPTLIEPLQPMPPDPAPMFATLTPPPGAIMPSESAQYPMIPMQTAYAVPHAPEASATFFHEHVPRPQDSTSVTDIGRRRRYIVIAISAAIMVAVGITLLVMLGIGRDEDPPAVTPVDKGSAATPDAAAAAAVAIDAAVVEPPPPPPPAAKCFVHVKTVPAGGEILRDGEPLGTAPAKLELPCGDEVKLTVRKKGFAGEKRSVTPTTTGARLQISLRRSVLVVKVSSSPPGATITMAGKNLGVTPAAVKHPAFESSTITLAKDGYNVESRKVVPKANNTTVHAALTKKRR